MRTASRRPRARSPSVRSTAASRSRWSAGGPWRCRRRRAGDLPPPREPAARRARRRERPVLLRARDVRAELPASADPRRRHRRGRRRGHRRPRHAGPRDGRAVHRAARDPRRRRQPVRHPRGAHGLLALRERAAVRPDRPDARGARLRPAARRSGRRRRAVLRAVRRGGRSRRDASALPPRLVPLRADRGPRGALDAGPRARRAPHGRRERVPRRCDRAQPRRRDARRGDERARPRDRRCRDARGPRLRGARRGAARPRALVAARPRVHGRRGRAACVGGRGARHRRGDVRRVPVPRRAGRPGGDRARRRADRRRVAAVRRPPGDRAMTPPVLRVEGVTYTYGGAAAPSLDGVSLSIAPGEFVVVAGLSASGKSTLLRAASGLVPHFHGGTFAGRVVVGGLDTREHGPAAISAVAGTLFQDPESQVVLGTVRNELAFPLENRGASPAAVARGVEEVALALGIEALLDRATSELSGGELQRVALGAALAGRPRLVLLDEPTSQLDPVAGDELVWLLRRLNEEWGTAVVLAEHRLERCLAHADRVVVLEDGAIACDAPPREFLSWAAEHAPALQTPGARLFARAGLRPPPAGVKEARATLRAHGLLDEPPPASPRPAPPARTKARRLLRRDERPPAALACADVWVELPGGRAILRAVRRRLGRGGRVALRGRNGAGKWTLLRPLGGRREPTRGRIEAAGRVALLLQNPNDSLLHERVADEAAPDALAAVGLEGLAARHPRDLSGGERQRLALAIVMGARETPAAVCLDEPTRGMDRAVKGDLADRLRALAAAGVAVLVATHDAEFAAAFAERVVLLADGRPIADGASAEVLTGGWYFATETARIVGALTPEEGAERLRRRLTMEVAP